MTNREAFDKVKEHLLTQMAISRDENSCLYRSPDGLQCSVGVLIPDDVWEEMKKDFTPSETIEVVNGCAVTDLVVLSKTAKDFFSDVNVIMLRGLQVIHDFNPPNIWEESLDDFEEHEMPDYLAEDECKN